MKRNSRIIGICMTLPNTPLQSAEILRRKSVLCDFELVDLLTYQYL
jgi:hypothetical protein